MQEIVELCLENIFILYTWGLILHVSMSVGFFVFYNFHP